MWSKVFHQWRSDFSLASLATVLIALYAGVPFPDTLAEIASSWCNVRCMISDAELAAAQNTKKLPARPSLLSLLGDHL